MWLLWEANIKRMILVLYLRGTCILLTLGSCLELKLYVSRLRQHCLGTGYNGLTLVLATILGLYAHNGEGTGGGLGG